MKRFMITLLCLLAAVCPPLALCAQNAQVLVAGTNSNKILLEELHIDLTLVGNKSLRTWTMHFKNTSQQNLDGIFQFPLESSQTISHFATDKYGTLRNAVPVPRPIAGNSKPGAASMGDKPGLFKRPMGLIPAGGKRTVVLSYQQDMTVKGGRLECAMPLAIQEELAKFSISVNSYLDARPELKNTPIALSFQREGLQWVASSEQTRIRANQALVLQVAPPKAAKVLLQGTSEKYYGFIQTPAKTGTIERSLPDHITILWDASLSGIRRNKAAELELLDGYLKRIANARVNLIVFSNTREPMITFPVRSGDWRMLRETIEGLKYDGGTQLGKLDLRTIPGREFLLFSDVLSGFGKSELITGDQPVFCINSTQRSDRRALEQIAAKSGGRVIDLTRTLMHLAMDQLLHLQLHLLGVEPSYGVVDVYPNLPQLAAQAPVLSAVFTKDGGSITLLYGYKNIVTEKVDVAFDTTQQVPAGMDLSRIWAQQKIASLDADFVKNEKVIERTGRRFGLPSRNTSLVVLPHAADYVRYDLIAPEDMKEEYEQALSAHKARKAAIVQDRIAAAERSMASLSDWWNSSKGPVGNAKKNAVDSSVLTLKAPLRSVNRSTDNGEGLVVSPTAALMAGVTDPEIKGGFHTFIEEADPLFGIGEQRRELKKLEAHQADLDSIAVIARRSDSALLDSLFGHINEEQYDIYLGLRPARLQSPTFYFQVAEQFIKSGRSELGARILSNLAELELEDFEVYKTLGYKMHQLGDPIAALEACRKALSLQPASIAARRELGLALAEAGQYRAAVDTLFATLISEGIDTDSLRMDETLICDINGILSQHPEAQIATLPRTLVQRLPMDIRVVLAWSTHNADLDLVVTEPNGERCYYAKDTTAGGGRFYADMRRGYGPEQYLLKHVAAGKYVIEAIRSGAISSAEAPTTLMAEVYTGWGKPEQRRYITVVHLKPKDNGRVLIGELDFGMKL